MVEIGKKIDPYIARTFSFLAGTILYQKRHRDLLSKQRDDVIGIKIWNELFNTNYICLNTYHECLRDNSVWHFGKLEIMLQFGWGAGDK